MRKGNDDDDERSWSTRADVNRLRPRRWRRPASRNARRRDALYLKIGKRASRGRPMDGRRQVAGTGLAHRPRCRWPRRRRPTKVRRLIRSGNRPPRDRAPSRLRPASPPPSCSRSTRRRAQSSTTIRPDGSPTSTRANGQATLSTYASPGIRQLPVSAVDTGMVMRVLEAALGDQDRDGDPSPGPHRGDSLMGEGLRLSLRREPSAVARQPRPSAAQAQQGRQGRASRRPALRRAARFHARPARTLSHRRPALEFAILTASRTTETLNATWSEFDLDRRLWTVPAERMKGDREHRVASVRARRRHRQGDGDGQVRRLRVPRCEARQATQRTWR